MMPLALAALALPAAGCDEAGIPNPTEDLCCTDFEVGADLSAADWGIEGSANATFSAFMQATADFAGVTTAVVNDVASACQAMALDMGASEADVTATDAAGRAEAWCQLAVTQINTVVKAQGSVTIKAQPPSCELSVSAQASCEASCTANVMCEAQLGDIKARCDAGQLSGSCTAECSGTCEGSANLAVACEGTCSGTCEGQCQGTCATQGAGGECAGSCDGTCTGKCRGSCAVEANANVQCEGSCTGGCSVELQAPRCKAELTPPSAECSGEAECSGSCKASASAKAECRPGSVEVVATGMVDARHIASLKLNLPKILMIAQARGELLFQNASALVTLSGDLVVRAPDLSVKAGLCAIPAAAALATAADNLQASVSASASITGALGM
jgi:modification target Cys-rich repeat protein